MSSPRVSHADCPSDGSRSSGKGGGPSGSRPKSTKRSISPGKDRSGPLADSALRKKPRKFACYNCRMSHTACSESWPCARCVRNHLDCSAEEADSCFVSKHSESSTSSGSGSSSATRDEHFSVAALPFQNHPGFSGNSSHNSRSSVQTSQTFSSHSHSGLFSVHFHSGSLPSAMMTTTAAAAQATMSLSSSSSLPMLQDDLTKRTTVASGNLTYDSLADGCKPPAGLQTSHHHFIGAQATDRIHSKLFSLLQTGRTLQRDFRSRQQLLAEVAAAAHMFRSLFQSNSNLLLSAVRLSSVSTGQAARDDQETLFSSDTSVPLPDNHQRCAQDLATFRSQLIFSNNAVLQTLNSLSRWGVVCIVLNGGTMVHVHDSVGFEAMFGDVLDLSSVCFTSLDTSPAAMPTAKDAALAHHVLHDSSLEPVYKAQYSTEASPSMVAYQLPVLVKASPLFASSSSRHPNSVSHSHSSNSARTVHRSEREMEQASEPSESASWILLTAGLVRTTSHTIPLTFTINTPFDFSDPSLSAHALPNWKLNQK
eukprot:ANDGO_05499.mRNA.1 hypothetical protein